MNLKKHYKYESSPFIKKEFGDFFEWYKEKYLNVENLENKEDWKWLEEQKSDVLVKEYFKEKDIILYGDIRKMQSASKRNPTLDFVLVLIPAIIGILLVFVIMHFICR